MMRYLKMFVALLCGVFGVAWVVMGLIDIWTPLIQIALGALYVLIGFMAFGALLSKQEKAFLRRLFCWHDWSEWDEGPGHAFRSRCVKGCGAQRELL